MRHPHADYPPIRECQRKWNCRSCRNGLGIPDPDFWALKSPGEEGHRQPAPRWGPATLGSGPPGVLEQTDHALQIQLANFLCHARNPCDGKGRKQRKNKVQTTEEK